MKTRALLLALPLLAVGGCTTSNHASVELVSVCATTDNCTFQSICTNTFMGEPAVDVAHPVSLWVPIEAANQLLNNSSSSTGRVNTNDAHVDTVVLRFGFGTVSYPTNQTVPANGTTVLGIDVFPSTFIGAQAALQAYAGTTLVVNLRVKGYYDDGTRFETGDFPLAVQVCANCIPTCPTGTAFTCPMNEFQYPRSCK